MGQFRTQLEDREYSGFRRYQAKKHPNSYKLWNEINPDVLKLLVIFERYLKDIGETTTEAAIQFREGDNKNELI